MTRYLKFKNLGVYKVVMVVEVVVIVLVLLETWEGKKCICENVTLKCLFLCSTTDILNQEELKLWSMVNVDYLNLWLLDRIM